jgi:RNA polymerase-interacting CarD/CdnL/TRCF family regulator
VGDALVDPYQINTSIQLALLELRELPPPSLPDMPEELSTIGTVKSSEAENIIHVTEKYLDNLKKSGYSQAKSIKSDIYKLGDYSIGAKIFDHLHKQAADLKQKIEDRKATTDRYNKLLLELRGVE